MFSVGEGRGFGVAGTLAHQDLCAGWGCGVVSSGGRCGGRNPPAEMGAGNKVPAREETSSRPHHDDPPRSQPDRFTLERPSCRFVAFPFFDRTWTGSPLTSDLDSRMITALGACAVHVAADPPQRGNTNAACRSCEEAPPMECNLGTSTILARRVNIKLPPMLSNAGNRTTSAFVSTRYPSTCLI
jgi:hypothetical protein